MATPPPESRSPEEERDEETRELLYEAYSELQRLAAELGGTAMPAPAVVVVGHQTDGKSALVEALMEFQFNHVGGGTKTRRPIALHLRFNPHCHSPNCRLLAGSGEGDADDEAGASDRAMPLADIQAYIEAENKRLENDPSQFSAKEIIIRIEYKHCPNLTIIDTPGLILAAPGRKNRVLQSQACAVEALVRAKIQHKETIILCLEDCSDWSNATTRRVVMQNRAGLRHFLDSFVAPEQHTHTAHSAGLHEQSSGLNDNKQDRPKGDLKSIHSPDSNPSSVVSETRLVDLLDSTLWNRRLAPSSERLVYALVHQIFHGIKEHFLVTTELKFNCFLLMPIVDKLAALLREDLESAFEDDLDDIFNVTQLRHSLGQTQRDLEVELKRIKRLKEKFGEINKKLNSLQVRQ